MTMPLLAGDEAAAPTIDPDLGRRWRRDLKKALDGLGAKCANIDLMWRYYNGEPPRVWLTEKIRAMFNELADSMDENYCEAAIDQPLRRLELTGWLSANDTNESDAADATSETPASAPGRLVVDDAAKAESIWTANGMDLEQSELYRHARVAGEAFIIAWDGDDGPELYVNDPRNVYWHPNTGNPRQVDFAAKVWQDEEIGKWRATLYYEFQQVRAIGPKIKGDDKKLPGWTAFTLDPDDPGGDHGFERVPVYRFAPRKDRVSALRNLRPIQDKINKLESNMMVAAEFGAFKQRAYLTQQTLDRESIRQEPDHAIVLDPGGDAETGTAATSIHEFTATELSNYYNTKEKQVDAFFTIANLPKHLRQNPGASPSGAAITADEGPFVEMIKDMHRWLGATWKDVMGAFGLDVVPQWRSPKTDDELGTATTVKTYTDAGVPVQMSVKKYAGWDAEEVLELQAASQQQQASEQARQQAMLMALDQGQGAGLTPPGAPGLPVPGGDGQ